MTNSKTKNLLLGIILTIAIIACSFTIITTISKSSSDEIVYADTTWTGKGTGKKDDPYLITTPEELGIFRDIVNASDGAEEHAVLNNDITLTGTWTPIGSASGNKFTGTFDGNCHTISGLSFNDSTKNYAGLFGYVTGSSEGTVIKNVTIEGSGITAKNYVGGIAADVDGGLSQTPNYFVQIINCHNYVPITASFSIGGIVGNAAGKAQILYCSNHAKIQGGSLTGGIVGYASGPQKGTASTPCPVQIENCYNDGNIVASTAGGIIGEVSSRVYVKKCFNYKSVTHTSSTTLGAIVGNTDSSTDWSFNDCHYLTISGSATDTKADGHNAAWFKVASNFANFDFVNDWEMKDNANYPTYLPEVNLYIAGHRVAVGSSSDTTEKHGFAYDRSANTLKLGNFYYGTITFEAVAPSWDAGIRSELDDLTIIMYWKASIDNKYSRDDLPRYGIYSTGNLTFTTSSENDYNGVKIVSSDGTAKNSYGIYCEGNIVLERGYLNITAGNAKDEGTSTGIHAKSLLMNGGKIMANSLYKYSHETWTKCEKVGIKTVDGITIKKGIKAFIAYGYSYAVVGKIVTECSGFGFSGIPGALTDSSYSGSRTRGDIFDYPTYLWNDYTSDHAIAKGTYEHMEDIIVDQAHDEEEYNTIAIWETPIHIFGRLEYKLDEGYEINKIYYNDPDPAPEDYKHNVIYSHYDLTEGDLYDLVESKVTVSSTYHKGDTDYGSYPFYNINPDGYDSFPYGDYDYKIVTHNSFELYKGIPDFVAPIPKAGLIYSGEAQDLIVRGYVPAEHNVDSTIEYKLDSGSYGDETPQGTEKQLYQVYYRVTPTDTDNYEIIEKYFYVTISSCDKTPLVNALNNAYTYRDSIPSKYTSSKASFVSYIENIESSVLNYADATAEEVAQAVTGLSEKINATKKDIVAEAIDLIGTPTYPTSKQAILDANDEYNNLDEELKPSFDQDKLNELAQKEEDYFKAIVNSLKPIEDIKHTPATEKAINDAKDWFNNHLTDEQKGHLAPELAELNDEEDKYVAEGVSDLIKAIGNPEDVHYTESDKEKIDAAKAALDQLTPKQKALIPQSDLDDLKDADDHYKAEELVNLVNDINDVSLDEESREKINKAIEAYDALSEEAKALVPAATLDKIEDVVDEYNDLVTEDVTEKINDIGVVQYTEASKGKIEEAMAAYDAMTDEQKALLPQDLKDKLEKAFSDYDQMDVDATRSYMKDEDNGVAIETEGRGVPRNVELRVEVKTEVSTKEGGVNPEQIQKLLKRTQKIAKVYDVKLIQTVDGVETEIQPSDIKEGMKIKVHMAIPEGMKTKGLNVLHIHNDGSIDVIDNVEVVNGEAIVEVSSFSEFALVEQTSHGFCIGWIVFIFDLLVLIFGGLIVAANILVAKDNEKCKKFLDKTKTNFIVTRRKLVSIIGLGVTAALFIFALVAICVHQCAITIIAFILALLMFIAVLCYFLLEFNIIKYEDVKKALDDIKNKCSALMNKKDNQAKKVEDQPKVEDEKKEVPMAEIVDEEIKEDKDVKKTEAEAEKELSSAKEETIEAIEAKQKAHEALTLKDSLVLAKAANSSHQFSKKFIANYLRTKDIVEVNERENFTKTGLPLADTHYVDGKDGKKCFAYVYETEGSIILLAKMNEDYAEKLKQKHSQINKSAFPKQKNTWYSLILDDTYTQRDVEDILDELIGEVKEDSGVSLKESIALAKANASEQKFTKAYVCEYLKGRKDVELNTRENYTKTGLPLADTHYVEKDGKKVCFAYVYEIDGTMILLAKMNTKYANELKKKHSQVNLSAFPKQKDTWYSLIIDDSYTKEDFEKIIDDISK